MEKRAALAIPEEDEQSGADDEASPIAAAASKRSLNNEAALSRLGLSSSNPWLQPPASSASSAQPSPAPLDAQLQAQLDAGVPLRSAARLVGQMDASSSAPGCYSGSGIAAATFQSVDEAVGNDDVRTGLPVHISIV